MKNKKKELTKNQKIVLDFIQKSNKPVKAYSILSSVSKKGLKAPPQVYRALEKLIKVGKIHKVESKNAFVVCKNTNCEVSNATAFSICQACEKVTEIINSKLSKYLKSFQDNTGMKYKKYNLEFFGLCQKCKSK